MTYLPLYANFNIRLQYSESRFLHVNHNKHEEEQEKEKKRKKNIKIVHFINDKEEEKNERSVVRWSERADKKTKENSQNVLKE